DPGGPWAGFPALMLRIPAIALTRVRGKSFATAAVPGAEALLDLEPSTIAAPRARKLDVTAVRNPMAWTAAVQSAAARLRAGEAAKVVLAREVVAPGDGGGKSGTVTRA